MSKRAARISWRARFYHILNHWVIQIFHAMRVIHHGIWLGILDSKSLQTATDLKYDRWGKYQDPQYNLSGLNPWEEAALDRYFQNCSSILLGGAGGGREIIALIQRGYQVDAFECHPKLVESCQELLTSHDISARILQAAPNHVPEKLSTFDGGVIGWGAYIHIPGRETRIQFLKEYRQHLQTGSPLLLSFFNFDPSSRHFYWVYIIARFIRRLRLSPHRVELGDDLDGTFDHYFTESEIANELSAAGYKLNYYSNKPYGHAVAEAI